MVRDVPRCTAKKSQSAKAKNQTGALRLTLSMLILTKSVLITSRLKLHRRIRPPRPVTSWPALHVPVQIHGLPIQRILYTAPARRLPLRSTSATPQVIQAMLMLSPSAHGGLIFAGISWVCRSGRISGMRRSGRRRLKLWDIQWTTIPR